MDLISRKSNRYSKADQEAPTDKAFGCEKAPIAPQVIASKASGKRIAAIGQNTKQSIDQAEKSDLRRYLAEAYIDKLR